MTVGAGKEILSHCSKCKLTLSHIIVAMKDENTIGRVMCNTCKAVHAYKDPSKQKEKKAASARKASGVSKRTQKAMKASADLWLDAVGKSTSKSQDYSPKLAFIKGDIINHSKFGPGVVDRLIDKNKIEVIFRQEVKTLIHNLK